MKPTLPRKRGRHPRPRPMATALVQVHGLRVVAVRTVAHERVQRGNGRGRPGQRHHGRIVYRSFPIPGYHMPRARSTQHPPPRLGFRVQWARPVARAWVAVRPSHADPRPSPAPRQSRVRLFAPSSCRSRSTHPSRSLPLPLPGGARTKPTNYSLCPRYSARVGAPQSRLRGPQYTYV